ncbi:MAG: hypothetical protein JNM39_12010 [Bdellovibrionaceae bacterium]|nr:hypothetical protein [Pseudobdellovibrionaceae bacterium]
MNLKFRFGWLVGTVLVMAACSTTQNGVRRGVASKGESSPFDSKEARELSDLELAKFASAGPFNAKNARLITDNFESYESKLNIVKNAKTSLRMVYYIFSDDHTSSELTNAIVAAATRGVKVTLLVDFLTNYGRIDLFKYMKEKGGRNLEVYFYGLPAQDVLKNAIYQTIPCPDQAVSNENNACAQAKQPMVDQIYANSKTTWFSRMYLSGLYGKNPDLLKISIGLGGQVKPEVVKGKYAALTKDDKTKLKGMPKLYVRAKSGGDLGAKMKLNTVLSAQGTPLVDMMNTLTGITSISLGTNKDSQHMTDYTHHKLMVADGTRFQMGGRNVEDSYHTDGVAQKYTFMDTDYYAETPEAQQIEASFDRLVQFKNSNGGLVGSMDEVEALVPNEYDINTIPFQMALQSCMQGAALNIEECVNTQIIKMQGYQSMSARLAAVAKTNKSNIAKMGEIRRKSEKAAKFNWREADGKSPFSLADDSVKDPQAQVYYLENISFKKDDAKLKRIYGSEIGKENSSGKGIHAAWIRGIENTCAVAAKGKTRKRIVLHSAYFLLPSGLTKAIGKTLDGTWNCSNVDIQIITNSFGTTDLNVLNVFARYQLASLFKFDFASKWNNKKATLKYSEYLPLVGTYDGSKKEMQARGIKNDNKSLHTKISVLGDDIIIGSANADVRSYFMDTNNAVMIRNAPNLVADYLAFLNRTQGPPQNSSTKFWDMDGAYMVTEQNEQIIFPYASITPELMHKQNEVIVSQMQKYWDAEEKHLDATKRGQLQITITALGKKIQDATDAILKSDSSMNNDKLEEIANTFDDTWKAL